MNSVARIRLGRTAARHVRCLFLALPLFFLLVVAYGAHVVAQTAESIWEEPINLSKSGAASSPALVIVPTDTLRVLWWDTFEGLMVVDSLPSSDRETGEAVDRSPQSTSGRRVWTDPAPAPILMRETVLQDGQDVVIVTPIEVMPRIVGDAVGRAHAFWLGDADTESGEQPLHYSRLAPDRLAWSSPMTIAVPAGAFDVAVDVSSTLHLAFVQPAGVDESPSGLYYRRSEDGGRNWSAPVPIQQSRYLRLLSPEQDALRVTAGDTEDVAVTWQDPRQGQIVVAQSTDGGATWQPPRPISFSDGAPLGNRVIAVPGQPERMLWPSTEVAGSRIAVSSSGDDMSVALWDGQRWAATSHLDLDLQDPDLGVSLLLDNLSLAFAPSPDQEGDGGTLAVAGINVQGDLWLTSTSVEALTDFLALSAGSLAEDAGGEANPVNLSRSGAASAPALVASLDGRLHAFWWDQFDGFMVADGVVFASSVTSGTEEIVALHDTWSEPRPAPLPVASTPWIVSDASGRVHVFWQQVSNQPSAGDEVAQPLLYSRLSADGVAWSSPMVLAESALLYDVMPDLSGALHLAYLLTEQTATSPPGIYYRQAEEGGTGWSAPALVYASRYLRLLTPDGAHLRLAASEADGVYITWDDPRLARALLAYSSDGGSTWSAPAGLGDAVAGSRRGRLAAPPGGEMLALWETGQAAGTCELHQALAGAVLDGSAGDGERVLESLSNCSGDERFLPLAEGQVLMMAGTGSEALTLALWDGERWSEPARWGPSLEDVEMDRMVYLADLHAALIQMPSPLSSDAIDGALVALGTDGAGDVWATSSQMGDLEIVFAPPSPWSAPVSVSQGDAYPGLPAVAADAEDWLHVLWSEAASAEEPGTALFYARWDGTRWTRPAAVLSSEDGRADEPALVAVGDRLHAVWSGGESGAMLYSSAFAGDAYASSGWSEPVPLPAPGEVGSWPDIAAGSDGGLHVVYAVPLNEGRGIYYTCSGDAGKSWSPARQVFDAAAEGWLIADHPQVAVDEQGLLHVAWVRDGLPGSGQAQGVYYASSYDGGETWSEAFEIATGLDAWPQVASGGVGQVHLVWNETDGQSGWWHRWSLDGGQTWTRQEQVSGFEGVSAPAALLEDGSGALYLIGLDADESPALLLVAWDGQRWGTPGAFPLNVDGVKAGVAASVQPAVGWLQVLFRAESESEEETIQNGLWHTGRQLPAVAVTPLPGVTPLLTATPSPTPVATATPRPTATFNAVPPAPSDSALPIPMPVLAAGGLAVAVVAAGIGGQWLWTRRR